MMLDAPSAVIVTGGSSGIGKSFLEHIGKLHPGALYCNLSRRPPDEVKASGSGKLKLRHFPCDLANRGDVETAVKAVQAHLRDEAPTGPVLLINNAGFGGYGAFPDPGADALLAMVDVNVRAVVDLTARFRQQLEERGGGVIIVASTAGFQPTPYLATYGATKAFMLHWGLALGEELRPKGVGVTVVCPGPTRTAFFARAGLGPSEALPGGAMSSDTVARIAFDAWRRGRRLVVPGWRNRLLVAVSGSAPKTLVTRVGARVLERVRLRRKPAP